MTRRVMTLAIALSAAVMLTGCAVFEGAEPSVERQASTCDSSYDRCVEGTNEWYKRNDQSRSTTRDTYEQMIYGCRTRREWCKQDIKASSPSEERTVKRSQREDKVPEPIEHYPRAGGATSGSKVN